MKRFCMSCQKVHLEDSEDGWSMDADCRARPPRRNGWPSVYVEDWCAAYEPLTTKQWGQRLREHGRLAFYLQEVGGVQR